MRRLTLFPALLLGLVPLGGAMAQDVGTIEANTVAAVADLGPAVDKAIAEFDSAYQKWVGKMRAASEEERSDLYAERPDPVPIANRLLGLVKDESGSETQWRAVEWSMGAAGPGAVLEQTGPMILEHFADKDELGAMLWRMQGGDDVFAFLKDLAGKTQAANVRGTATFAMAGMLAGKLEGSDHSDEEKARIEAEAVALYKSLEAAEYAEVVLYRDVTLGSQAKSSLFELQNLSPGKTAADIAAEDMDGTEFKLSDYRGKVVMLDFWGDW